MNWGRDFAWQYIYICNRISTSGHQSFTKVIPPPPNDLENPGTTSERGQVATLDGGGDLGTNLGAETADGRS